MISENSLTPIGHYIAISKYARWLDDLKRRETWGETAARAHSFMMNRCDELGIKLDPIIAKKSLSFINGLNSMPSMRLVMTAGKAAEEHNAGVYNCSYLAINDIAAFSEVLYILACGTGVGFSVERQEIKKLPLLPDKLTPCEFTIIVEDDKIGWAKAFDKLLRTLYDGYIPRWDISKVRGKGARLVTFGGRASGPGPLVDLFEHTIRIFSDAVAESQPQLYSIDVHSIVCKVGESIVSGGVRRSALISLSNPSDLRMRDAKSGDWWKEYQNPHFALANNSAAWTEKPSMQQFFDEWHALYKSRSGERGIFNRKAALLHAESLGRRVFIGSPGVNPCGEISLHSAQMCNLSECIARPNDTLESLIEKLEIATLFGVIQSTFTDFKYLRPEWKANTERERLLGVSITGIMGCPILNGIGTSREERNLNLDILRTATIKFTEHYSKMFGISMPAAITCIKPSGTVSKLVASDGDGIHAAKFRQGIRRFQENNVSPICTFLKDMGVPNEPLQSNPNHVTVFDFPLKYADTVVTKDEVTAIQMMENWYDFKKHWAEHSVSSTIDIREKEWLGVGDWVYRNFNEITGISFQPFDGGIYKNAPYHSLTPEEFEEFNSKFPQIHWNRLNHYEDDDNTEGSKELACVAGNCDV